MEVGTVRHFLHCSHCTHSTAGGLALAEEEEEEEEAEVEDWWDEVLPVVWVWVWAVVVLFVEDCGSEKL